MENSSKGNSPSHAPDSKNVINASSSNKRKTRRSKKYVKELINPADKNFVVSTSNNPSLHENIKVSKSGKMKSSNVTGNVMENLNLRTSFSSDKNVNNDMVINDMTTNHPGLPTTSTRNVCNKTDTLGINKDKFESDKNKHNSHREKYKFTENSIKNFVSKRRSLWKPLVTNEMMKRIDMNNPSIESELTDYVLHFDISPVKNPQGLLIRKRSSCKYVNLLSFGSKYPLNFVSNFTIKSTHTYLKIMNKKIEKVPAGLSETAINEKEYSPQHANIDEGEVLKKKHLNNSTSKLDISIQRESKSKNRKPKKVRIRVNTSKKKELGKYSEYFSEDKVEEGLSDGSLIKGFIRINQRNSRDAYVTNIIKGDTDYLINSIVDQNRALDGDQVILKLKPKEQWDEGRKTAYVVYIAKMIHSRTSVGKIVPLRGNDGFAEFIPRDNRFPTVHIPTISWPQGFKSNPEKFSKNLFVVKITEWTSPECARGLIIENIGKSGDLKIENLAILKACGLDHEPFSNDALKYLSKMDEIQNSWLEDKSREDLRKECIFSIDPLTARDLDDAVSCKYLSDGNLEIGVHIADVSQFLLEGTELDKQVGWKATTIYMVNQVYHMLPVELCMSCSLLPARDKLSFSVFWKITPDGDILSTRFAKTVMNSCVQLAYEHAQAIIDDPDNFDASDFPKISNGYVIDDIKKVVLQLYAVSKILRRRRFENGALRIDQIKLSFDLDPDTGMPLRYHIQEQKEANRLIEEFMLLANISVAEKIINSFPDIALLRRHEPPKESMMKELKSVLESIGIHIDITSAKSIQSSLLKYSSDDSPGRVRSAVLNHLFAKPMTRARYFCPSLEKAEISVGHYALNIPLYTHFTSPIRRYADIMVHRLLAASLGRN
ncbi:hypothetical protein WA026_015395 [Henosepilachna vigintioctopunctata]|uniref:RNB domain-containing protein n=1 Tax=Henosepilachna vigintioctopunctata TaxID=420089 RepID=A0AAW1UL66_9CUCU